MEDRNLEKSLEIITTLIKGEEINRTDKNTAYLYDEYSNNSGVYQITNSICKKLNLSIFEYEDGIYASAGENNRVFGYSNDDMKKEIGVKLNRELYLCYLIIYIVITRFYNDTGTKTFVEYIKIEEIISAVDSALNGIISGISVIALNEVEENSFKTIAIVWEDLPMVANPNEETSIRAARGSKFGFVKMTLNFLIKQDLLIDNSGRYYPKKRFKALAENYFENYKGRLYEIMKGDTQNASD